MSLTKTQAIHERRKHFPGYLEAKAPVAFSSNNPFRATSVGSESSWGLSSSPFEDTEDVGKVFLDPGSFKSASVGDLHESKSVFPIPIARAMSSSPATASSMNRQSMYRNSQRQYNTSNNQSAVRNSTNPFIDEPSSPVDPVSKPMRPSTSTKPTIRSVRVKQSSRGAEKEQREEERREQRDEKRDERREERRRERSDRPDRPHRSEKSSSKDEKHRSSGKGDKKKGVPLDIIDKLDVTGLFGPGSFHHDGPFDACNPHRNKNTKEAPVLAFPADGANNSLTAVDPNEKYATENKVFGRSNVDEVYDYRGPVTAIARPFDSSMKQLPVHGDTTLGLGSSTFLDGTPASREAIVKSGEEASQGAMLGRKKSLVAKLRGSNGPGPAVPPKSRIVPHLPLSATSGPIIRTNSHPVQSPSMKDSFDESIRSISSGDKESSGGGGSGLLRRVKSLKVGSRRKGS